MPLTVDPSNFSQVVSQNFKGGLGQAVADKAAQNMAINGMNIEQASKANIYKTQVLSAAAGTGNQDVYNTALQHLSDTGVDVSDVPKDVATGANYAAAGRVAQSPLGALFNAQQKMIGNNVNAAGVMGSTNNVYAQPVLDPITGKMSISSQIAPQQTQQVAQPQTPSNAPSQSNTQIPNNNFLATEPGAADSTPPASSNTASFQQPPQEAGETLNAYKDRVNQAFEQYKADPNYQAAVEAAKSQAGESGKLQAQNDSAADKAQELTDRLTQNLNAMKTLNYQVPTSGLIPASAKVWASQAAQQNGLGSGEGVNAASQWDQINNQQVLSEIQQFIASGGANARVNQTLERLAAAASGIDKEAPPQARESMINNALAEIQNKNVSAQNIAGDNQPYQAIPVTTSQNSMSASQMGALPAADAAFIQDAIKQGASPQQAMQYLQNKRQ